MMPMDDVRISPFASGRKRERERERGREGGKGGTTLTEQVPLPVINGSASYLRV